MIITTPLTKQIAKELKAGDIVNLSGIIYTARDAAHKAMVEDLEAGRKIPFDLKNQIIYYVGPAPAKPYEVIGSAGPTTSYRMDTYTPYLMDRGLVGMIGKGKRSQEVINSMVKNSGIYFGAIGGAGALIASHIKKAEIIGYEYLGTEAIHKLEVENFSVIVIIDSYANNLYESEKTKYREIII